MKGYDKMRNLILKKDYKPTLDLITTQKAIKEVKDVFSEGLARALNLCRVSAPLFVKRSSGLNDNLNGVERTVSFNTKEMPDENIEVVQSLAKWKRFALSKYGFKPGFGLFTDMNAIRRDEDTDNIHSIFVDQWDWEKVIEKSERNMQTLKETVIAIYGVLKDTERHMCENFGAGVCTLADDIFFVTTQELEDMYPDLTPKEREYTIVKEKGAVFLMQIGGKLKSGKKHDGRAPDYDDWTLNGDIIIYYPVLDIALEISSMGIRVDEDALALQLKESGCEDRRELPFQKALLEKRLPYTIGGGIGQSRICMFFLKKMHIGEVQSSVWDDETARLCAENGVPLL